MLDVLPHIRPVCDGLLSVGFREDRLRLDVPVPGTGDSVSLVAFADQPFDSRTAAVAVMNGHLRDEREIAAIRPLGAPLVFVCLPDHYHLWKQGAERPQFYQRLTLRELPEFFSRHREDLAPRSIYRAKIWSRLDREYQLDFVDAGLLPLVEQEAGQKLTTLIERVVADTKRKLGWRDVSAIDGRWLLQSTFWLLAAKILQDKAVSGFMRLDLSDVETVYKRLATHYNSESPRPVPVRGRDRKEALVAAADQIKAFTHCGVVSTEALAHLYESALIDKTVRRKLGTHSTPSWLVDYVVGKLRPWVEQGIAPEDRRVFEPACGHAGFLIAAMRLLSELLPRDWPKPRRSYLRERLYGLEVDGFALEIARLSLTLADIPNPNGWSLIEGDMFRGGLLDQGIRDATIVLGNPPFESFLKHERRAGWLPNKAAETFRRVIANLPAGGVFGFVLPQTFLNSKQAADVRRALIRDYEIGEISLFADKVFRFGEPESTLLVGRRLVGRTTRRAPVHFQRVREWNVEEFARTFQCGGAINVPHERFESSATASLLIPDLSEVWDELRRLPKLANFAVVEKGFEHKSDDDLTLPSGTTKDSPIQRRGFVPGFANWSESQMTHGLPSITWLNLSPEAIRRPGGGMDSGKKQVLLNHAPVGRDAWRLKALLDRAGHPVKGRFLVVRPRNPRLPLSVVWAILNSPIGNAYVYSVSSKRDVLAKDVRGLPVPDLDQDLGPLERAVEAYFAAAQTPIDRAPKTAGSVAKVQGAGQMALSLFEDRKVDLGSDDRLRVLHWRIDAEVLRLYGLSAPLERKVLDLFQGVRRRGVPFEQDGYIPMGTTELKRLADLLAITSDWSATNRRRAKLIDLEEARQVNAAQSSELERLQMLADARVSLLKPNQTTEIDEQVKKLQRRGLWKE